jgi:plastocyanin
MEQTPKTAEAPKPKSKRIWVVIAAIVIIAIIGVAAFYWTRPPAGTPVSIVDEGTGSACGTSGDAACKYSPQTVGISTGKAVTWTNKGGVSHTVTTKSGTPAAFDHTLSPGDTYTFTFSATGTYNYFCSIHPWMTANVTVT